MRGPVGDGKFPWLHWSVKTLQALSAVIWSWRNSARLGSPCMLPSHWSASCKLRLICVLPTRGFAGVHSDLHSFCHKAPAQYAALPRTCAPPMHSFAHIKTQCLCSFHWLGSSLRSCSSGSFIHAVDAWQCTSSGSQGSALLLETLKTCAPRTNIVPNY